VEGLANHGVDRGGLTDVVQILDLLVGTAARSRCAAAVAATGLKHGDGSLALGGRAVYCWAGTKFGISLTGDFASLAAHFLEFVELLLFILQEVTVEAVVVMALQDQVVLVALVLRATAIGVLILAVLTVAVGVQVGEGV